MLISQNCSDVLKPNIEIKQFPDGESYVRIVSDYSNEDTVLHRLYPNQSKSIFELLQIIDTLSEYQNEIVLIIPYLAYARQERRVIDGEAISARAIIRALASFNVKKIITFDCHFMKESKNKTLYDVEIINIHLSQALIQHAKEKLHSITSKKEKILVIAPDKGASYMNVDTYFIKERGEYVNTKSDKTYRVIKSLDYSLVEEKIKKENISNAILIDDIIASGTTIIEAAKLCKELGIKNLAVCCTHGQFLNNADKKILEYAKFIVTSNTILNPYSEVNFWDYLPNAKI